jgi:diguanylate cyclase (GGDEF)-like protein
MASDPDPYSGAVIIRRIAPFAVGACLAFPLVVLPPPDENLWAVNVAALITLLIIGLGLFAPWGRLPAGARAVLPLAYFLAIALLRDAEGGAASGYGTLVLLPILWLALYGTRRQLLLSLAAMTAIFVIPIFWQGGDSYPSSEWRRALLWLSVAPVVGFTVQGLVVELRQRSQQLRDVARTDALTGLPNRRAWEEELPLELSRARRAGRPLCVAILDLDHFKAFNDNCGHQAGDRLLKETASAWRVQLRDVDFLARYGGEEFGLLLPNCSVEDACEVVERVRAAITEGQTCSAGVASWDGSEPPEALLRRADEALYQAKDRGRDRAVTSVG